MILSREYHHNLLSQYSVIESLNCFQSLTVKSNISVKIPVPVIFVIVPDYTQWIYSSTYHGKYTSHPAILSTKAWFSQVCVQAAERRS